MCLCGTLGDAATAKNSPEIAPYSQQLGDLFTQIMSVLVKPDERKYRPAWGRADEPGNSRKSQPEFASGCTGAPAAAGGGV
jgi:hypothetical protein